VEAAPVSFVLQQYCAYVDPQSGMKYRIGRVLRENETTVQVTPYGYSDHDGRVWYFIPSRKRETVSKAIVLYSPIARIDRKISREVKEIVEERLRVRFPELFEESETDSDT
jgi:hypothetical protein